MADGVCMARLQVGLTVSPGSEASRRCARHVLPEDAIPRWRGGKVPWVDRGTRVGTYREDKRWSIPERARRDTVEHGSIARTTLAHTGLEWRFEGEHGAGWCWDVMGKQREDQLRVPRRLHFCWRSTARCVLALWHSPARPATEEEKETRQNIT